MIKNCPICGSKLMISAYPDISYCNDNKSKHETEVRGNYIWISYENFSLRRDYDDKTNPDIFIFYSYENDEERSLSIKEFPDSEEKLKIFFEKIALLI